MICSFLTQSVIAETSADYFRFLRASSEDLPK